MARVALKGGTRAISRMQSAQSVWQMGYGPMVRSLMNAPVRDMGQADCAEDGALRVPDSDTERPKPEQEGRAVCRCERLGWSLV